MTFRVFSNDRGKKRGTPLYSCLDEIKAPDMRTATASAKKKYAAFGPPRFAPLKCIEWPPTSQESQAWLDKHVSIH